MNQARKKGPSETIALVHA